MKEESTESTAHTPYKISSLRHSLCQFEVPQKQALPESRMRGQGVYLGGDVRKDQEGSGAVTQEQGEEASHHWGCVEPSPRGASGTVCEAAGTLSPER